MNLGVTVTYCGIDHGSEVKVPACNAGDLGSIPGLGRSPGEGNGNPLQYSCLENPMDGGAWWATVLLLLLLLSCFSRVQLCATPVGSPPGSPVPGILQARTLMANDVKQLFTCLFTVYLLLWVVYWNLLSYLGYLKNWFVGGLYIFYELPR